MGEEILEGTVGGLLAGVPMFFVQDQDKGQAALMTAGAVLGGIGVGMAGRRLGAELGKRIHPGMLKDQDGAVAAMARTLGSESTLEGLEQQGRMFRGQVADYLVDRQATKMLRDGEVTPELLDELKGIRQTAAIADALGNATPEQRARMLAAAGLTPGKLEQLSQLEKKLTTGAVDRMDESLMDLADQLERDDRQTIVSPDLLRNMTAAPEAVTGEHVGRMVGRVAGDEIGVVGGLALAGLLASQMGIQSPKDLEIARLKQQLGQA